MFAYASRMYIYMLSTIVLLATLLTSVNAKPSLPTFNDLQANSEAIQDAARSAVRLNCATAACMSVIRLNKIFDIILDGEATYMGEARLFSLNQPYVKERRLHLVLLNHPNRFGSMCALLMSLASRYGLSDHSDDPFVGLHVIDLALRMDGYGPAHCLPAVLSAMPFTQTADSAIHNARLRCESEPAARNPCARIVRPVEPTITKMP